MTDGTRPPEGEHAEAPAPVPPYAAAPPTPPSGAVPQAPLPPYAAPAPYPVQAPPHATHAGASNAQTGGPRQDYPGAPPTWGPPAGGPGTPVQGAPWQPARPAGGSPVLGVLALVASILGFLVSLIPFVGGAFAWALFVTAIVLAIIALVRRTPGKGLAIAAIVVSAVGFVVSVLWAIALVFLGSLGTYISDPEPLPDDGEDEYSYSYPSFRAPELGTEGNTAADPLAPGTTVALFDENVGADMWEMTVLPSEDLTAAALANGEVDPVYGAYVGVPVQLTNVTDETIDLATDYAYLPYSSFVTGDGGEAETAYLYDVETYPGAWDLDTVEPGESVTFYEVYDVAPDSAASGSYLIDLDSGQTIYWGAGAL